MSFESRIIIGSDGVSRYVSIQGDMLDHIAHQYFGEHGRNTSRLLELNPELAEVYPSLPAGTVVVLPQENAPLVSDQTVSLWD